MFSDLWNDKKIENLTLNFIALEICSVPLIVLLWFGTLCRNNLIYAHSRATESGKTNYIRMRKCLHDRGRSFFLYKSHDSSKAIWYKTSYVQFKCSWYYMMNCGRWPLAKWCCWKYGLNILYFNIRYRIHNLWIIHRNHFICKTSTDLKRFLSIFDS